MNIIAWCVVGISVGWLGSLLMGTDSREGLIRNIVIGTAGALVGTWVFGFINQANNAGGVTTGWVVASVIGAAALVAIARRFRDA